MEFKTKSGKKVKFKEISVLELCKLKDVLHNSTDYNSDDNKAQFYNGSSWSDL